MFVRPPSKNKKKKEAISHFVSLTSCRRQSHSAGHVPTEGKRQKATVGVGVVSRCRNTRSAVRGTQSSLTAGKRGITTTEQPSSWEVSNHLWRNRDEAVNCIRLLKSAMQKKNTGQNCKTGESPPFLSNCCLETCREPSWLQIKVCSDRTGHYFSFFK